MNDDGLNHITSVNCCEGDHACIQHTQRQVAASYKTFGGAIGRLDSNVAESGFTVGIHAKYLCALLIK